MQISLNEWQDLLAGIQLKLLPLLTTADLINQMSLTCHLSLSTTGSATCLKVVLLHLPHLPKQNNNNNNNNNNERGYPWNLPHLQNNSKERGYPLNLLALQCYQLKYNKDPLIVLFKNSIIMKKCCLCNRVLVVYLYLNSHLWAIHSTR